MNDFLKNFAALIKVKTIVTLVVVAVLRCWHCRANYSLTRS